MQNRGSCGTMLAAREARHAAEKRGEWWHVPGVTRVCAHRPPAGAARHPTKTPAPPGGVALGPLAFESHRRGRSRIAPRQGVGPKCRHGIPGAQQCKLCRCSNSVQAFQEGWALIGRNTHLAAQPREQPLLHPLPHESLFTCRPFQELEGDVIADHLHPIPLKQPAQGGKREGQE